MLWGDSERFAVEAEFTHATGKWRFGRFRMWVAGTPVGDFEEASDLASGARWGRTFLANSAKRTRPDLEFLEAKGIFYELFEKYIASTPNVPWNRDAHLLDDVGEASLRDKISIVVFRQQDGQDRIIVRDWKNGTTQPRTVEAGLVDDAIRNFSVWAESL